MSLLACFVAEERVRGVPDASYRSLFEPVAKAPNAERPTCPLGLRFQPMLGGCGCGEQSLAYDPARAAASAWTKARWRWIALANPLHSQAASEKLGGRPCFGPGS